jgi:hypothetical protein
MGYELSLLDNKITIPAKHLDAVAAALLANLPDGMPGWVEIAGDTPSLSELLEAYEFEASLDDAGNIIGLCFTSDRGGVEDRFAEAIAPFVKRGSYLEWDTEGELFRHLFDGTSVHQIHPKVTWPRR